jgi:predicted enzyme related to lactoylglutathione lyase
VVSDGGLRGEISVTIVPVQDMDRAVRFYQDVMGFSLKFASPEWSEFDTRRVVLALQPAAGAQPPQQGEEARFTIDVESMEEEVARLEHLDVQFPVLPHEESYGLMAVFHDTEGNGIELVERIKKGS